MKTLLEAMHNLKEEQNTLSFEEFLNNIKQEEISFYREYVNKYHTYDKENRSKYQPTDDSQEQYKRWANFIDQLDNICSDYDVQDYSRLIDSKGEEAYQQRLEKDIDNHIAKLSKSITKEVGKVLSINPIGEDVFHVEGNNGIGTILLSPIKLSKSKSITKTRIKINDVTTRDVPLDFVPKKEDNEYIKQWKENELQEILKMNDMFWTKLNELKEPVEKAKKELKDAKERYTNEHGIYPKQILDKSKWERVYEDPELFELSKKVDEVYQPVKNHIDRGSFYYKFGNKPKEEFIKICKDLIDKHFDKLQAKVEKDIGEILKIEPTGNNGYDYHFDGEKGSCNVEVILAGGYNIQRLHTRWIIRNIKRK